MIRPLQTLLLLLLLSQPSLAQKPTTFTVTVTGTGRPMLLIPGLGCPGAVWDQTVAHYKNRYQCHVISLAGFGGVPAAPAGRDSLFLQTVRNELLTYIRQNHLQKPVVVGHSLGGHMALWLASTEPKAVGPLVIVDGMPFFAGVMMPGATIESARSMAAQMRQMMTQATPEQTRAQQTVMLRTMVTDPDRQRQVADYMAASDGTTIGQAMYGLYTTDLRADLARITSPALVIGAWIGYKDFGATHDAIQATYKTQFAAMPRAQIIINDTARHFIMFDDPTGFFAQTDAFLAKEKAN